MDWTVADFVANGLRITPLVGPSFEPDTEGDYSLSGIPKISLNTPGNTPTGAAWNKPFLTLTWPEQPGDDSVLMCPASDPAFRSRFGAYLSSKKLELQPNAPIPVNTNFIAATPNGQDIVLTNQLNGGQVFLQDGYSVINNTKLEISTQVKAVPGFLTATFPTPPEAGDEIIWGTTTTLALNQTGGGIQGGSLNAA